MKKNNFAVQISKGEFCAAIGVSIYSWIFASHTGDQHYFWKSNKGEYFYQSYDAQGKELFCNRFKKSMFGGMRFSYRAGGRNSWSEWHKWIYAA